MVPAFWRSAYRTCLLSPSNWRRQRPSIAPGSIPIEATQVIWTWEFLALLVPKNSLFVGIEAKVDERFGSGTVCQMYRSAGEKRIKTPSSKVAARIEGLLSNYFSEESEPCDSRFSEVGYQLLTGTAGTVATQVDFVVFYVMVFKTGLYDPVKGRDNRLDYERFIKGANGKVLTQDDDDFQAHEVTMAETRLVCVYDSFNTHGPD